MPGGIGSIDLELALNLRCNDRATGLGLDASPTEIYYNLGMDRVHYVPQTRSLYFPHSSYFPVLETLEAVFRGADTELEIEQLFMDRHGYYKGAQRTIVPASLTAAVLVALRLNGIRISLAGG